MGRDREDGDDGTTSLDEDCANFDRPRGVHRKCEKPKKLCRRGAGAGNGDVAFVDDDDSDVVVLNSFD